MDAQRRKRSGADRQVESLEDRVELSGLGSFGAWQSAMRGAAGGPPSAIVRHAPAPASSPTSSPFRYATPPGSQFFGRDATPPTWRGVVVGSQSQPRINVISMRTNTPNAVDPPPNPRLPITVTPPGTLAPPQSPVEPISPPVAPTNPPPTTPPSPLPPNAGGALSALYQSYASFIVTNPDGSYYPPASLGLIVAGGEVGVYVHGNGQGDFNAFVNSLKDAGMNINATSAATWTVSGMLPILNLPTVAGDSQTLSVTPRHAAVTEGGAMRF